MTHTPPSRDGPSDRLERDLVHLKEMMAMREEVSQRCIAELRARLHVLETEVETREEKLRAHIARLDEKQALAVDKLRELIWSGHRWLGTTLVVTVLSIVLKTLKLI